MMSTLLPRSIRDSMLEALEIDPGVPPGESEARIAELNAVIMQARLHYPQLFRGKQFYVRQR